MSDGSDARPRLHVNPLLCDGVGYCAEIVPELITLDDWGYPIIAPMPIPERLAPHAQRAVATCPVMALALAPRPQARTK